MKLTLVVFLLASASLVAIVALRWVDVRGSVPVAARPDPAPSVEHAAAVPEGPQAPAPSARRSVRSALEAIGLCAPDELVEPGASRPGDEATQEEAFPWLLRDPPRIDGPVFETAYPNLQPEFSGRQVRGASGAWVRDGPWSAWYQNGQLCEHGRWRLGAEDGPWRWWYENGRRMAEGAFVEGRRVGEWTYWQPSGDLLLVGSYRDGEANGLWTLYHEDGWKQAEGPYVDGLASGPWNVWRADGTLDLERSGTYVDGAKVD